LRDLRHSPAASPKQSAIGVTKATAHGYPHLDLGDGASSRAGRPEPMIHHSPPAIAELGTDFVFKFRSFI
jgi:hypothetical protein